MIELFIGIVAGAVISWAIAHAYYKKSSTEPPDWAKPIIAKLPEEPPSQEKLVELFQDALDKGEAEIDPITGYAACPQCKAPAKDFERQGFGDDDVYVVSIKCPHCGWDEDSQV
jgi:rubredoxin